MLTLIASLLVSSASYAEAPTAKSRFDIYADEEAPEKAKDQRFSAKVRVVREIYDEVEVFFEGAKIKGAYTLPRSTPNYGAALKHLESSRKPGGPSVSVTADEDKRIKAVEIEQGTVSGKGGFSVPSDPNAKWDFGDLPN
jgi:hypothetical protein